MPSLNFQARFADQVESGVKTQTIRAARKRPFVEGDTLYLFTGMRTSRCRSLGKVECLAALGFEIHWAESSGAYFCVEDDDGEMAVLTTDETIELAKADGFDSYVDMLKWFEATHELPFRGQLIIWERTMEIG